jgi:hypothetical protein
MLHIVGNRSPPAADYRQAIETNRHATHSPNFHFAILPSRAIFALGMNLSLAAKRITTSTSSIISTTTKSITANGEARN